VTLPVRAAVAVFRATVNVSVPERLPFAFAGSEIHAAELDTAHGQPVSVSTDTATSAPTAGTVVFEGETV
jgi:hypothetical protein